MFRSKLLLEVLRVNCNKIEPEANHSIDQYVIPAKTKKSVLSTTLKTCMNGVSKIQCVKNTVRNNL